jgi:hypothetical protein
MKKLRRLFGRRKVALEIIVYCDQCDSFHSITTAPIPSSTAFSCLTHIVDALENSEEVPSR